VKISKPQNIPVRILITNLVYYDAEGVFGRKKCNDYLSINTLISTNNVQYLSFITDDVEILKYFNCIFKSYWVRMTYMQKGEISF